MTTFSFRPTVAEVVTDHAASQPEPITAQQAMALAWRGFGTPHVEHVAPREYAATAVRPDGQYLIALGRSPEHAVDQLARLAVRS